MVKMVKVFFLFATVLFASRGLCQVGDVKSDFSVGILKDTSKKEYWKGSMEGYLIKISKDGYFGLIDSKGKILCIPKYDEINSFNNGFAVVNLNGKYGLINNTGEEIVPVKYDFLLPSEGSMVVIREAEMYGYYDIASSSEIKVSFENALSFSDGLAGVKLNGKWGFIDKTGKAIIKPTYDTIRMPFKNSMAIVVKDNRYSIINKEGKELASYDNFVMLPFSNRLFKVVKSYDSTIDFGYSVHHLQCDSTGIIDSVGNVIFPVQGGSIGSLVNGYASISTNPFWNSCINRAIVGVETKYFGIIDSIGQVIISRSYNNVGTFLNNFYASSYCPCGTTSFYCEDIRPSSSEIIDKSGALLKKLNSSHLYAINEQFAKVNAGSKWGVINQFGEEIIPATYDELGDTISEGLIAASDSGKWGFINLKNKVVIDLIYDNTAYFANGVVRVNKNKQWGLINKTGKVIVPATYDEIVPFYSSLFWGKLAQGWVLFDKTGKIISKELYEDELDFKWNIGIVRGTNRMVGYFDSLGKLAIPCEYDFIIPFTRENHYGFLRTMQNNKYRLYNLSGKIITVKEYYDIKHSDTFNGLIKVRDSKGIGFIDLMGQEIIPCHYSNALDFTEGLSAVQKDSKWGYINKKGEIVIDFIYDEAFPFGAAKAKVRVEDKVFWINREGRKL